MNEKLGKVFIYGGLGIIIVFMIFNSYTNRNWEKEYPCISWDLYGNSTCEKPTNKCTDIKAENNAWIQECRCDDENKTQKVICNYKQEVMRFKK